MRREGSCYDCKLQWALWRTAGRHEAVCRRRQPTRCLMGTCIASGRVGLGFGSVWLVCSHRVVLYVPGWPQMWFPLLSLLNASITEMSFHPAGLAFYKKAPSNPRFNSSVCQNSPVLQKCNKVDHKEDNFHICLQNHCQRACLINVSECLSVRPFRWKPVNILKFT